MATSWQHQIKETIQTGTTGHNSYTLQHNWTAGCGLNQSSCVTELLSHCSSWSTRHPLSDQSLFQYNSIMW